MKWFGLDECSVSSKEPSGVYHDGAYCPVCKAPMEYDYYHYNQIGAYRCTACGHRKPATDFTVTSVDLEGGEITIGNEVKIPLAFRSIYNVYNILAAYAVCSLAGVSRETAAGVIGNYILKNGRMVRFLLGSHHGTLLTSKHENSVAYDTNLRYIRDTKEPCTVVVIVDAVSRKYFTSETSWLWDIDFSLLNVPQVERILLCGRYANDLAVRFSYTGISPEKWELHPDIREATEFLKGSGEEDVYVVTCFSDRDKLLVNVVKEAV